MLKRVLSITVLFQSLLIASVGDFSITSSTHQIGIPSSLNQATFNWTTPEVGTGEKLSKYLWKFDRNSSSDLEEDNLAKEISISSNSLTINLSEDGEFYFHLLPVLESGDTGVDKTFGKIKVDLTPPTLSISTNMLENGEVEVTLSTPESSSEIYYSTDGSDVDENSTLYSEPFTIYFSKTLKFRGVDSVDNWSEEISKDIDVDYSGNVVQFTNIEDGEKIATDSINGASSIKPIITLTAPNLSTYQYRVDLGSYSDYVDALNGIDISRLLDGEHTIYVRGRDELNNTQVDPSVLSFTIDNLAPQKIYGYIDGNELNSRNIYSEQKKLTLQSSESATIRYTVDGDTPSKTYGSIYSQPIDILRDRVIRAVAYDSLGNIGDIFDFNVTFDREEPEDPKIYDSIGELNSSSSSYYNGKYIYSLPQKFGFISSDNYTENPTIYWEIGGKTPNILSSKSGNTTISSSTTLKFMSVDEVNNSTSVFSRTVVIDENPPQFLPLSFSEDCPIVDGVYICTKSQIELTLSAFDSETPDIIDIYYTTNGNQPSRTSSHLSNDSSVTLQLSENEKSFKYIAYDKVNNHSDIEEIRVKYDIESANDATEIKVTLSLDNNSSINGSVDEIGVTILNGGSEPIYYYKIDDSNFSHESNLSKGVDVSQLNDGWHSLSVVAFNGEFNSTTNSIDFFVDKTSPASPTISGTSPFVTETNITISTDDENATIYYSIDGATPTTQSHEYTGQFQIYSSRTVKAIAVDRVGNSSGESSQFFELYVDTSTGSGDNDTTPPDDTNSSDVNTTGPDETNTTSPENNETETTPPDDTNTTEPVPDDKNIVDIEDTPDGENLTLENSSGDEQKIVLDFQNIEVISSDLSDGGREYIYQTEDVTQTLSISPSGSISGEIVNREDLVSVEINSSLGSSEIKLGDGEIIVESEAIISDNGNSSQLTLKSNRDEIAVTLVTNGNSVSFPKIPLDGEEAKVKAYLKRDNSIEIELEVPLSGSLRF